MSRIRTYTAPDGTRLFSAGKLAEALQITTPALRNHVAQGTIPRTKFWANRAGNNPIALYSDDQIRIAMEVYDSAGKGEIFKRKTEVNSEISKRWSAAGLDGADVTITA
jgi:hypothetical protein